MKKNLFAWASISETKGKNGKVGDQTGTEVKTGYYYDFGQTKCIRISSISKRRKVAEIAKYFAGENKVGYGQSNRHTFFDQAQKCKWSFSSLKKKITPCNTDCSMFYAVCVNLAFGKEIFPVTTYTGNVCDYADHYNLNHKNTFKIIPIKTAEKAFKKGDAPIKEYAHIIINV